MGRGTNFFFLISTNFTNKITTEKLIRWISRGKREDNTTPYKTTTYVIHLGGIADGGLMTQKHEVVGFANKIY